MYDHNLRVDIPLHSFELLKQHEGVGADHSLVLLNHLLKIRPQNLVSHHFEAEQRHVSSM